MSPEYNALTRPQDRKYVVTAPSMDVSPDVTLNSAYKV